MEKAQKSNFPKHTNTYAKNGNKSKKSHLKIA